MKPSILFAVDNDKLLKELISITIPLRDEFDCFFAENGEKAIQLLANNKMDIVFSSTEIVLSSGANLLQEIKRLFPETIRFALVKNLETSAVARTSQYVHQFVTLPLTKENLKERINNILHIQSFLRNEKVEELIKNTTTLPSLPEIYIQIEEEVAKKDFSLNKIANLISKDPNLTAKILQIVNSAYFGLRSEITNINYALTYLGVNVIKSLVFYIHLFSNFKITPENKKHLERFW
ncbi:MAG: HDOD domain-containing protein, partial [Candidatus Kapaibacteriota bacterium]